MLPNTVDKILGVANRLFHEKGYTATSVRQIAEESGIGKATIYHYFQDKEAIALALLRNITFTLQKIIADIKHISDPREQLTFAVKSSMEFLYHSSVILQIVRREVPEGWSLFRTEFLNFFHEYITTLSEAIQKGIEIGIFRPVHPAETAKVLLNTLQGTFSTASLIGNIPQSCETVAAPLLDIFFNGIDIR